MTEQHLLDAVDVLGKGAGLKEVLGNAGVDEKVKRAVRSLLICMSSVVGSNAHRTTLRHISRSYTNLVSCVDRPVGQLESINIAGPSG